jgi:hypothetical protein
MSACDQGRGINRSYIRFRMRAVQARLRGNVAQSWEFEAQADRRAAVPPPNSVLPRTVEQCDDLASLGAAGVAGLAALLEEWR